MKASVSIVRAKSYEEAEVHPAIERAIGLLGASGETAGQGVMERFIKKGQRVLIKPNLLSANKRSAAVTTDPSVVDAIIGLVKEAGGVPFVGDSPGLGSAKRVAEKCGIMEVVRKHSCEFKELSTPVTVDNPDGRTFKRFVVAKEALEADAIINLPKLKTHAQMYLTLGVKNLFGCIPGKRKPQWHLTAGTSPDHFAGMLLDLHTLLKPTLTLTDGVISMEGNGPGSGDPVKTELILASADTIALDVVTAEAVGAQPRDVPVLKRAKELGLGTTDLSDINVLGETLDAVKVRGFNFPLLVSTNFTAALPYFIDKRLRKALSARPHIETSTCTLCNVCVSVCPVEVMEFRDGREIVIDYDGCIRCYCCQEMCPQKSISLREGWLKKLIPGL